MSASFHKDERLRSRKAIQALFNKEGNSFAQYPLRLIWMPMEERRSAYPVQFGLSVPKRRFKKAVDRNKIRRKIREAYRLQKQLIYTALAEEEQQYAFMVLYTGQESLSYQEIEKAMQQLIRRFLKILNRQRKQTNQ